MRPWKEFSSAITMHLLRPAGGMAGGTHELQRPFDRLGSAVGEKGAIQSRLRAELLRQQSLIFVVVEVGDVDDFRRLLADGLDDAGMGMAQGIDAQPGEEVEIAPAINVVNVNSLSARNGKWVAGVGVQQVFLLKRYNFFISKHDDGLAKVYCTAASGQCAQGKYCGGFAR